MEKPSTISGFRVLYFWLSLVLYLSQACLHLLTRVSGLGAHEVCGSVSIAILDLPFIPSCLIALARNSTTILNRSGDSGHPCLLLDFRGDGFSFSPLSMMLAVDLS
jgi:hypothetical protein